MSKTRIGVDIVDIGRIEKALKVNDRKFISKIFTDLESEYIIENRKRANTIAGMFSAKEAVSKLLGSGIGKLSWKDIELDYEKSGRPFININKKMRDKLDSIGISDIDISISHEKRYAISVAVGITEGKIREGEDFNIPSNIKGILKGRKSDTHKGSYGRIGILAGSRGMTGAPYLSCQAALRSGSGLVYAIIPESIGEIMSIKLTEAIIKTVGDDKKGHFTGSSINDILNCIESMDAIAIGPGMGVGKERIHMLERVIENYGKTIILDADAINCLSIQSNVLYNRDKEIIITPHPGELGRLLGKSIEEIQANRIYYAKYTSDKYNIIVILKGDETVIACPENDDVYVNDTGNPGMATAGSGDVLTGMIASFLGQGIRPLDAAILSVFTHGLAGDLAKFDKGEHGLIASDIIECIPEGIKKILV